MDEEVLLSGKYAAYSEYKDSGIGWQGQVPKHWYRTTFKHLLEMMVDNRGRTPPTFDDGIPLLEAKQVDGTLKYTSTNFDKYINKEGHAGFIRDDVKENDILFITVGTIGKTCLVPSSPNFVIAQNIVALRTKAYCSPNFLLFWLRSMAARESMLATNKDSILDSIKISDFVQSRLNLPKLSEQLIIANFLDHETAKIDTLIDKQQQLIKLLKEKRQAVISHAVTKGINPDAPMRDSGVEWFDQISIHWVVSKFSYLASVVRGGSPRPAGDLTLFDGDYSPWVTVAEITKDNEIYLTNTESFLTQKGSIQCRVFSANTLILSNSGGTLGVPKILKIDANANDGVLGFENLRLSREFVYFYLTTLTDKLREQIRNKGGSTQINLNTDIVKNISIPVPPSEEIKEIVLHILQMVEKYKNLVEKAEIGIELLKERRTALISAAVTGKIDVRNWAAPVSSNNNKEVA